MQTKSIFRLSVLTSALVLAGAVQALGLGRLTVQSSLGQPLTAQIELTSASKEELDTLSAKVADPSLYKQNNLAYAPVLARARVAIERSASGQTYLLVSTPTSVNEPYLDLMVELNWASGRVVREYTFLLDPPGAGVPAPAVDPVAPVRQGRAPPRAAPATAMAPAAAAPAPRAAAEPKAAAGDKYPVQRGDTLSKIAAEVKPSSVTLEQMLVALFKTNEAAFDGNMNRLRSGTILTIPAADEAGAMPAGEAAKIVRVQAADWRGYRDRVAAGAPEVQEATGRAAAGKIGTAVEEKTPAAPAGRDQLKVSPGAAPGRTAAAEQAAANAQALRDAQTRIADLEKTLKSLQQAVELKNQSLAQLQAQADVAKGKAAPAPAPPRRRRRLRLRQPRHPSRPRPSRRRWNHRRPSRQRLNPRRQNRRRSRRRRLPSRRRWKRPRWKRPRWKRRKPRCRRPRPPNPRSSTTSLPTFHRGRSVAARWPYWAASRRSSPPAGARRPSSRTASSRAPTSRPTRCSARPAAAW
ncbi:MAG: hypothetical protein IPI40_13540 [Betaproteobacteria bacterium]|nr:hypothetical protein [Betaproteobacteria bacterium]